MDLNWLNIILLCVLGGGGGFAGVKWLFRKDTEVEERRRSAATLASTLSGIGLRLIPEFLVDYSVGDYSSMAHKIKAIAKTFSAGEGTVLSEFEGIFDRLLSVKLRSESGRALIASKLADFAQAGDTSVVGNAPIATLK
jgi:hypothetical protein